MPYLYETLLIVTPEADDDGVNAVIGDLRTTIEADGGTVLQAGVWQRRQLAYQVMGKKEGIYVLIYADGETTLPYALKDRMKLDEAVIRSLVVRLEDQEEAVARAQIATGDHTADDAAIEAQRVAAERRQETEAATAAMSLDEIAAAEEAAAATAAAEADEAAAEAAEATEAAEAGEAESSDGADDTAPAEDDSAADDTAPAEDVSAVDDAVPAEDSDAMDDTVPADGATDGEAAAEVEPIADPSEAPDEEPASEEAVAGSDEAEIDEEKEN